MGIEASKGCPVYYEVPELTKTLELLFRIKMFLHINHARSTQEVPEVRIRATETSPTTTRGVET